MQLDDKFIFRCPVKVSFAGLTGTTEQLVRQGWELSLMKSHAMNHSAYEYSFYGFHKKMNLRCMSARFLTEYTTKIQDFMLHADFPVMIEAMAQNIMIQGKAPERAVGRWDGALTFSRELFEDSNRYMYSTGRQMGKSSMELTMPTAAIDHYARWFSVDDGRDIYIPRDEIWTVEKHLNAIREIQEPKQAEIRKRILDERARENLKLEQSTGIYLVG